MLEYLAMNLPLSDTISQSKILFDLKTNHKQGKGNNVRQGINLFEAALTRPL